MIVVKVTVADSNAVDSIREIRYFSEIRFVATVITNKDRLKFLINHSRFVLQE